MYLLVLFGIVQSYMSRQDLYSFKFTVLGEGDLQS